jgi:D-alanyl-D-alanine carboxypeptidase
MFDKAYTQLKVEMGGIEELQVLLRNDQTIDVQTEYEEKLIAPVRYGKEVGTVRYYLNGEEIAKYPIIAGESVGKKDLSWYFERVLRLYMGIM